MSHGDAILDGWYEARLIEISFRRRGGIRCGGIFLFVLLELDQYVSWHGKPLLSKDAGHSLKWPTYFLCYGYDPYSLDPYYPKLLIGHRCQLKIKQKDEAGKMVLKIVGFHFSEYELFGDDGRSSSESKA